MILPSPPPAGKAGAVRISGRGRITIPKPLRDRLRLHGGAEVEVTPHNGGVLVRRRDAAPPASRDGDAATAGAAVTAAVGGRLREVDTERRSAQLHEYGRPDHIPLRFGPELGEEMRRLESRYVEIRGAGRIDDDRDRWIEVRVEELRETRSWEEPFDLDAFLARPREPFDPDHAVTASDMTDEEFESFLDAIRIGRGSR